MAMKNIGGLWKGYGKVEFYGNINGLKFLIFKNKFKSYATHPDYIIVEERSGKGKTHDTGLEEIIPPINTTGGQGSGPI